MCERPFNLRNGCCGYNDTRVIIRYLATGPTGATGATATITPAAEVQRLSTDATLGDAVTAVNDIIAALQNAGLMEAGAT